MIDGRFKKNAVYVKPILRFILMTIETLNVNFKI